MSKKTASQNNINIALAGNPNSGKTTIFNNLTGTRQHVGNYPGVTVEKKEGEFSFEGRNISVVDLPGTYSLTAYSVEELVARNYVIEESPDMVVDVIDTSNLERSLYLATQFMELNIPLILAFNMSDVAKARGLKVNIEMLSRLLNVEIVQTIGHKGVGIDALKHKIVEMAESESRKIPTTVTYGDEIEGEIKNIMPLIEAEKVLSDLYHPRWTAVKLLEKDERIEEQVRNLSEHPDRIFEAVGKARRHIRRDFGDTAEIAMASRRYGFISGACQESVISTVEARHNLSDRIDAVVTSRLLGLPIFLVLMYLVFKVTFSASEPLMGWIESFFGQTGMLISAHWPAFLGPVLESLVVDGIIGGVGGVLVFLPNILILFLAIALLEDSGYMARAAFVMDHIMHRIGLHGKSFIPMLIGFGCTVPAIMATRTLESRRDRLTTILVLPLMSCSARMAIYALLIPAFFPPEWRAPILWILYLTGILVAVALIILLRKSLFSGEVVPFVLELPPYRTPTISGALIHTWERGWMFLKKAGTIIVVASIILWALSAYPKAKESELEGLSATERNQKQLTTSVAGNVGRVLEPVMRPIGFDWKASTAMVGAFAAKELFVSQLSILYAVGDGEDNSQTLREKLQGQYTRLQAFCIMVFCLLSIPCVATIVATWKESGHIKWALLQLGGLTLIAYLITLAIYQVGSFLQIGV